MLKLWKTKSYVSSHQSCDQLINWESRNCTKAHNEKHKNNLFFSAYVTALIIKSSLSSGKYLLQQFLHLFDIPTCDAFIDQLGGHHIRSPVFQQLINYPDQPCASTGHSSLLICHWFSLWTPESCKLMKRQMDFEKKKGRWLLHLH